MREGGVLIKNNSESDRSRDLEKPTRSKGTNEKTIEKRVARL